MVALALIVLGVFIDPVLGPMIGLKGVPLGPTVQVLVAAAAYRLASPAIHRANLFTFHPVQEVGFLFVGIFLTMAPALAYLQANGARIGLETPSQYFFATGVLSAFLDNAPTYLNFLQAAFGLLHLPLDPEGIDRFVTAGYTVVHAGSGSAQMNGAALLAAISLGAVFFGAMTYIGNGPNFMVRAIAEKSGVKMPSFFGFMVYSVAILLPILVAMTWLYLLFPY
jgi:Na+/H+ antiporter NhaD/arsenite permease-like protein